MSKHNSAAAPMRKCGHLLFMLMIILSGCLPADLAPLPELEPAITPAPSEVPTVIPQPTRPPYSPGELVDYITQPGDTLPALASHFNTTTVEIRAANPFIPSDATTMPPGMPMKIPIYYQPLWGSSYQIIPDAHFVNGPAGIGFDPVSYVQNAPGWLKTYRTYVLDRDRSAGEVIQYVATNYSVSPRLLIALLEYQLGAFSLDSAPGSVDNGYALGVSDPAATGLYRQLAAVANSLNNSYYEWRAGSLTEYYLQDGQLVRPDPWQNAATVALQVYFANRLDPDRFSIAISPDGFAAVFTRLFGDPWLVEPHIPGSLRQPEMRLPFQDGSSWTYTGGPHTPWGSGAPLGAIDFAPPLVVGGCTDTDEFATAVSSGVIARTGSGIVVLDLDGDADERTGWVVFYLHLAAKNRVTAGQQVLAGQTLGHPSCEGGTSTGTHVHIARKYNGEWVLAEGLLAFNLDGWVASNGDAAYAGYLKRNGRTVTACECSDKASQIQAEYR